MTTLTPIETQNRTSGEPVRRGRLLVRAEDGSFLDLDGSDGSSYALRVDGAEEGVLTPSLESLLERIRDEAAVIDCSAD